MTAMTLDKAWAAAEALCDGEWSFEGVCTGHEAAWVAGADGPVNGDTGTYPQLYGEGDTPVSALLDLIEKLKRATA